MSSILKALKKVENDQSSAKPKTLPPLAKMEVGASQSASSAKVLFTGLLLFFIGAGSVYYFTNPSKKSQNTTQPGVSTQKNEPAKISKSDETKIKESPPVVTPQTEQSTKQDLDKKLLAVKPTSKPVPATKPDNINNSVPIKQPVLTKTVVPPTPSAIEQPARQAILEVNGIAYQGENGDSIAVINGVSVSKNSVIEGFTVQNIHQDRVTFSKSGKNFDVELGKTNR